MKRFGIIGFPLKHSFSKDYFTKKFNALHLQGHTYDTFELTEINNIQKIYLQPDIIGLNVTIPYKESVLHYIDYISDEIKKIGACNCIKFFNHQTYAYNTDIVGFEKSLQPLLKSHHQKALILGSGGASKAVQYVFEKINIEYLVVSRSAMYNYPTIKYEHINQNILNNYHIIINTTPLGMYPEIDNYPPIPYEYLTSKHLLYDLIYNPEKTLFLEQGEAKGCTTKNGYEMLILQAEENWQIWQANKPPGYENIL